MIPLYQARYSRDDYCIQRHKLIFPIDSEGTQNE